LDSDDILLLFFILLLNVSVLNRTNSYSANVILWHILLHPQAAPSRLETPAKKFKITEVRAAIKHMRTKKAPGYDLITGQILKELP
jgi:hypothetical protein